jgi:regulator of replication initiation timing
MTSTPVQPAAVEQTTDTLEENSVKYKNKYLEMLEENRKLRIEIERLRKIKK